MSIDERRGGGLLQIAVAVGLVLATSNVLKAQSNTPLLLSLTKPTVKILNSGLTNCFIGLPQKRRSEKWQSIVKTERAKSEWRAGTYRGLTIGKSTRPDMLRVLGQPIWSGQPGDQAKDEPNPEIWNEYGSIQEFLGKLTVVVDKRSNIIMRIDLYPKNMPKEEAVKRFGYDYISTRYDFDQCLGNEESAPLYESPNGPITEIEYRKRGIAIGVDNNGWVKQISYVNKPLGATSAKCNH